MYRKNCSISDLISARKDKGLDFDRAKLEEIFALMQSAKRAGRLGSNRPRTKNCCPAEQPIDTANELLRSAIDAVFLQQIATSAGDEIYVYISLVSLKCFKAIHVLTA